MRLNRFRRTFFKSLVRLATVLMPASCAPAAVVDFEDLLLSPDSFHNGDPGNLNPGESHDGSFLSQGAQFNNFFELAQFNETVFELWSGWSYSNRTDMTTPGFTNQFSAIVGHDAGGSGNYGVAFLGGTAPPTITLPGGAVVQSVRVTNTTYAYRAVVDGDDGAGFVRQFGDDPDVPGGGNQGHPDEFLLTIIGRDGDGETTGTVDFYLADYRFASNDDDFAVDTWELVDLSPLGSEARTLDFMLTSSDSGPFGINTPNYFALDDLAFEVSLPLSGDTNSDGVVNIIDLNNVRNHFGEVGMSVLGDTNRDGMVDVTDLNNVRNHFGTTAGVAMPAIPEPAGLALLAAAIGLLVCGRSIWR